MKVIGGPWDFVYRSLTVYAKQVGTKAFNENHSKRSDFMLLGFE